MQWWPWNRSAITVPLYMTSNITGDLGEVAINDLIAHYRDSDLLDVDAYQIGHHGSNNGTTAKLLHEMTPEISVISMGPFDLNVG